MIETEGLHFQYKDGEAFQFPDVTVDSGSHCLLLGQSGSGKTTLLHLLAGLRRPKEGKILINKGDITKMSGATLDRFRGKNVGIIFQQAHFVEALSVEQNLRLAQRLAGLPENKGRIRELLDRLQVGHKFNAKPAALSVGEQQRVAIARALVNNPAIILADEPTSALDDKNAEEVILLLKEQATAAQASLLIVTHDQRMKDQFSQQITLDRL